MNMKAIMCCIHLCEVSHIDSKYSKTYSEIPYDRIHWSNDNKQ